ncbi:MAG: hypothetical protein IJY33_03125 [Oscillospiraceae bacterium]|nr:hypothetical protein [Oscillospiraceae bacterium]
MRNDYIMDMIEDFGEFLLNLKAKTTHNEEFSTVNHDESLGEAGLQGIMLKRMCASGNINEAENLLFDLLDAHPEPDYFYIALDFYKELSLYNDNQLADCDFSRDEIAAGLSEVIALAEEHGISHTDL